MSAIISKDELSKSLRMSFGSASVREVLSASGGDVFQRNGRENNEDEEVKCAAIERLSTLDDGKVVHQEVDVINLGLKDKKKLMESMLNIVEEDNERFLFRVRDRIDR